MTDYAKQAKELRGKLISMTADRDNMTADRDNERRWANDYCKQVQSLTNLLGADNELISYCKNIRKYVKNVSVGLTWWRHKDWLDELDDLLTAYDKHRHPEAGKPEDKE